MRLALFALVFVAAACGDHAGSVGQPVDQLAALEKDPRGVLATKHPTYKATYEMRMTGTYATPSASPASPANPIMTMTQAARPPEFRWDYSWAGAQLGIYAIAISAQQLYVCMDQPKPAACYTVPGADASALLTAMNTTAYDQYLVWFKDMDFAVLPRERIASHDGACFRWTPRAGSTGPLPGAKIEACFSAEGIMLRTMLDAGVIGYEQRAVAISDTVTDADVGLPFPATSAPNPLFTAPTPTPAPTH